MQYYLACLVVMSASALRVAVQGSGMASATVARLLMVTAFKFMLAPINLTAAAMSGFRALTPAMTR